MSAVDGAWARSYLSDVKDGAMPLGERQIVMRAMTSLAARDETAAEAFDRLRRIAMAWRVTMEVAAQRIVAAGKGADDLRNRG